MYQMNDNEDTYNLPGVTAGKSQVNDFLREIRGSNQYYNERARNTGFELLFGVLAWKLYKRWRNSQNDQN